MQEIHELRPEGPTIRATISINFVKQGKEHHLDEIVEAINEEYQSFIIASDNVSANPRWILYETYRDIVITDDT